MRVDQLIAQLTTLAAQFGQDTPVYTVSGDLGDYDDIEISGTRIHQSEESEGEDGEAIEILPERIFLKV